MTSHEKGEEVSDFVSVCMRRYTQLDLVRLFLLLEVLQCSPPFSRTDTFFFPPLFKPTKHSPSLQKASRRNPRPLFQTACEMMSRWCVVAWPVSAKKTNCILLSLNYDYIGIQIIYLLKWKPTRQTYFKSRHFGSKFSF